MGKLDAIIPMATSTRYAHPEQAGQILPEAYGDLRYGGEGGLLPAVLIDTINHVYCCANHAVEAIDSVWDSVGNQLSSGFTISVSDDYEGQGAIARITFSTPQIGTIYWRGRGKQSGGVLITNPISAWEDLFTTRLGWTADDFDATAWERARADCEAQGYTFAWLLDQERTAGAWLGEWCADILADHWLDRWGRLVVHVETARWVQESAIADHLVAARDAEGGDAGVSLTLDFANVCNQLRQYYLWHFRRGEFSSHIEAEHPVSRVVYGDRARSLNFPTVRSSGHLAAVADVLFRLFAGAAPPGPGVISFPAQGFRALHLTRGDMVGISWDAGPARQGDLFRNHICKVLNLSTQLPAGPIRIDALDLGQRLLTDKYFDAEVGDSDGYYDALYSFGDEYDLTLRP